MRCARKRSDHCDSIDCPSQEFPPRFLPVQWPTRPVRFRLCWRTSANQSFCASKLRFIFSPLTKSHSPHLALDSTGAQVPLGEMYNDAKRNLIISILLAGVWWPSSAHAWMLCRRSDRLLCVSFLFTYSEFRYPRSLHFLQPQVVPRQSHQED